MINSVSPISSGWAYASQVNAAGENRAARQQPARGGAQEAAAGTSAQPLIPGGSPPAGGVSATEKGQKGNPQSRGAPGGEKGKDQATGLDKEEQAQVTKLKARDLEVRAHERAHLAAGGSLVRGGVSFEYQIGPDGKRYAVGGEVSIDTSAVPGDPQATLRKAAQIQRAALAPAQPSAQDYRVAASAAQIKANASIEMARKNYTSAFGGKEGAAISTTSIGA